MCIIVVIIIIIIILMPVISSLYIVVFLFLFRVFQQSKTFANFTLIYPLKSRIHAVLLRLKVLLKEKTKKIKMVLSEDLTEREGLSPHEIS